MLQVPIVNLVPAADVAEQDEPEPPQELAPPAAFTASFFDKVDKLEDQEVSETAQLTEAAAAEAEPTLKKASQARASAHDLTLTLAPAPLAGAGVPAPSSGTLGVDFSSTEDSRAGQGQRDHCPRRRHH